MRTNEQINAEVDRLRRKAADDAADRRVIPNSGCHSSSVEHHTYTDAYKAAGGKN